MFIDGVFSGGGIKGYALVGALQAIENKGLRFVRVAGTSAGSIIAAFVAAGYTADEMNKMLDEMNVKQFLDERKTFLPFSFTKWLLLYWRLGLYKGDALEAWLTKKLAAKGIYSFGDLPPQSLRIIASDLTSGRIVTLPEDLPKYNVNPRTFPVAKAIRMSCSIPYFFEPVKLKNKGACHLFVDGGVLSNFPLWLFDNDRIPKVRPALGIQLSSNLEDGPVNKINNAITMFGALFETMKDAHDAKYISRRHEKNIIFIPTDHVIATEFELAELKKEALVQLGKQKAELFLRKWCY
ncbi:MULTISPECIES: patatin-like phospholipase family protein [Bacillus]|uniref:patatin-like phospholipase family protein n=1 Tax=Bacillus TaxID=1386 RepID=UPI000BB7394F|nr:MULTISPECIES: patatin-like phospholipase family protein [Bacillus]